MVGAGLGMQLELGLEIRLRLGIQLVLGLGIRLGRWGWGWENGLGTLWPLSSTTDSPGCIQFHGSSGLVRQPVGWVPW